MNAMLFDTHQIVKRLMAAGFSDGQAEAVTDVVREARQVELENLATKAQVAKLDADLSAAVASIAAEFAAVRAEMKSESVGLRGEIKLEGTTYRAELAEMKADLLRWGVGMTIAAVGLIVTLPRLLPPLH